MRLPGLHLLSAFDAVARQGSISKAAKELHITAPAVSHRIAKLEEFVGTPLLRRVGNCIFLTLEGEKYSVVVKRTLVNFEELSTCFSKDVRRKVLRIHTGPGFARFWLIPRLGLFRERFPSIDIDLSSSFDPVDFDRDPVDLWIRRGDFSTSDFFVENFFSELFVPLASPEYLRNHPINSFEDLQTAPLIFCSRNRPAWPDWFKAKGLGDPQLNWTLALSHAGYGLEAATQGLGVFLESLELAEIFLRDKRLVQVFPENASIPGPGHHIICPPHHLERPTVRSFKEWLLSMR